MFKNMTAEEFVCYIANDYVELSQEKVRIQRDDYIKQARQILDETVSNEKVKNIFNDNF